MDKNNNEDFCSNDLVDSVIKQTNCSVDDAKQALLFNNGNVSDSVRCLIYDIKTIMEETNCSLEIAKKSLFNNECDIVNSILEIISSQGLRILDNNIELSKNYPIPTHLPYVDLTKVNNYDNKRKLDELSTVDNNDNKRKCEELLNTNDDKSKVNKDKISKGGLQKLVDFSGYN